MLSENNSHTKEAITIGYTDLYQDALAIRKLIEEPNVQGLVASPSGYLQGQIKIYLSIPKKADEFDKIQTVRQILMFASAFLGHAHLTPIHEKKEIPAQAITYQNLMARF